MTTSNIAGQTRDPEERIRCPKCAATMEQVAFGGVTVDRCVTCHGIWFDARENERLKATPGAEALDAPAAAASAPPTPVSPPSAGGKIKCPVCHTQMIQMTDVRQPHLKFESCTVCYGTFFDAGEFRDYKELTLVESVRGLFGRGK